MTKRDTYDIILIGLGISGGTFLTRVRSANPAARIAVVERGEMWDLAALEPVPGLGQLHGTLDVNDNPVVLEDENGPRVTDRWWSPKRAGGGSVLWYGQMHRFDELDLRPSVAAGYSELDDHELRDWPLSLDELEPYYTASARAMRPFTTGADLTTRYAARARTRLAGLEMDVQERISSDSTLLVKPTLSCLGGKRWDAHPVAPNDLGGDVTTGPLSVRPNPLQAALQMTVGDERIDLITSSRVLSVITERGHVTGCIVRHAPTGRRRTLNASMVVLACGTLESVRIALDSRIDGMIGAGEGFTFTNEFARYVVTGMPRSSDPANNALETFATLSVEDQLPRSSYGRGKITIYVAHAFEMSDRSLATADVAPAERDAIARHAEHHYVLKLSFKGDSIPWHRKRIALTELTDCDEVKVPVVQYRQHRQDLDLRRYGEHFVTRVARSVSGSVIRSLPTTDLSSAHQHGGLRFGTSSETAVLSSSCEAFAAVGLFVVDGSFMPTSGHTNSSWTIMANAMRVADHVATRT